MAFLSSELLLFQPLLAFQTLRAFQLYDRKEAFLFVLEVDPGPPLGE
jgi:hypothetical protein